MVFVALAHRTVIALGLCVAGVVSGLAARGVDQQLVHGLDGVSSGARLPGLFALALVLRALLLIVDAEYFVDLIQFVWHGILLVAQSRRAS